MTREDFMENTLDVWEIPAESARRVGHPAPFPIELPQRLIELYTFVDDRAGQVTGQGVQGFFVATPGLTPLTGSSTSTGTVPATPSGTGYGY